MARSRKKKKLKKAKIQGSRKPRGIAKEYRKTIKHPRFPKLEFPTRREIQEMKLRETLRKIFTPRELA